MSSGCLSFVLQRLAGNPSRHVHSFDLGTLGGANVGEEFVHTMFPQRLTLTRGDSSETVPEYLGAHSALTWVSICFLRVGIWYARMSRRTFGVDARACLLFCRYVFRFVCVLLCVLCGGISRRAFAVDVCVCLVSVRVRFVVRVYFVVCAPGVREFAICCKVCVLCVAVCCNVCLLCVAVRCSVL